MQKSNLVTESGSHSSLANLAVVADSTDIAGLIPRHVFEAKSISKRPAKTPFWIISWADLRIPITVLMFADKDPARGRQTDRQKRRAGWQVGRGKTGTGREKGDGYILGLKANKGVFGATCTRGRKKVG